MTSYFLHLIETISLIIAWFSLGFRYVVAQAILYKNVSTYFHFDKGFMVWIYDQRCRVNFSHSTCIVKFRKWSYLPNWIMNPLENRNRHHILDSHHAHTKPEPRHWKKKKNFFFFFFFLNIYINFHIATLPIAGANLTLQGARDLEIVSYDRGWNSAQKRSG